MKFSEMTEADLQACIARNRAAFEASPAVVEARAGTKVMMRICGDAVRASAEYKRGLNALRNLAYARRELQRRGA